MICILFFVGCKSIPEDAKVYTVSYATGAAAAKVIDKSNITDKTTTIIIKTLNDIQLYVPATNETFTSKWMPIISTNVKKMSENNEITSFDATLIEHTFIIVCNGLDYLVEKRYPNINTYENLMSSAIYGFSAGFLSYFNSTNTLASRSTINEIDKDEYLKALKYLENCKN
jgi:hypothetical protein